MLWVSFLFLSRAGWKAEDSYWPSPLLFIVVFLCVCLYVSFGTVIETLCEINGLCIFYFCISIKGMLPFIFPVHISMLTLPWQRTYVPFYKVVISLCTLGGVVDE